VLLDGKRSGGTIEYFHTLMAAMLVAPGHSRVVPLEPEFVVPQDGHDKQDCETVNWLMIEIRNPAGEVTYRNSFVTDLPADRDTVVELTACGRARWKIENESFNSLKTKDNFGHGKQHLSAVRAILNLLAFAFHTVAELTHDLWLQAINKAGARRRFFEHLRSIRVYLVFPSWQNLLTTLAFAHPPSQPP
jgi:hypothetical protein